MRLLNVGPWAQTFSLPPDRSGGFLHLKTGWSRQDLAELDLEGSRARAIGRRLVDAGALAAFLPVVDLVQSGLTKGPLVLPAMLDAVGLFLACPALMGAGIGIDAFLSARAGARLGDLTVEPVRIKTGPIGDYPEPRATKPTDAA
jgi:hypothetical protein